MAEAATCSMDGCGKPARCRGWCNAHYKRWLVHGDPTVLLKAHTRHAVGAICLADDCDRRPSRRGMCGEHYYDWWKINRPTCSVDGCERPVQGRGLCARHRQRLIKFGHPLAGPAFRRDRGTGLPRWIYGQKRDSDKRAATPDVIAYAQILRYDPCSYCGEARCEHIDHIDPFIAGGRLEVANVTAACASCNHRKQSTPLLLFLASNPIGRRVVM